MRRLLTCVLAGVATFAVARPVHGQSRPLVTEDPETVPAGYVLIEGGVDYAQDVTYPVSGLRGNLWRIATFGVSFGVSSIAEVQLDGGLRNRLTITSFDVDAPLFDILEVTGNQTSDFEDLSVGTKIRFLAEGPGRPAMAVRFWTRLPNAENETGLGLDTTDFHVGMAIAKTVNSVRVAGNFGFGILADPVRGDRQNDVVEYGVSIARAVARGAEIVGDFNGRLSTKAGDPPPGTETRAIMRLGARFTRGPVRVDGALIVGVTEIDPTWGFSTGLTWVFKGFTIP